MGRGRSTLPVVSSARASGDGGASSLPTSLVTSASKVVAGLVAHANVPRMRVKSSMAGKALLMSKQVSVLSSDNRVAKCRCARTSTSVFTSARVSCLSVVSYCRGGGMCAGRAGGSKFVRVKSIQLRA